MSESYLAQLTQAISGNDVGRQIANAQMMFNIIGVVAVIGFLPIVAQTLEKLIPEMEADRQRQAEKHQANSKNRETEPAVN